MGLILPHMKHKFKIILLLILFATLAVMSYSYSHLPFYPSDYPAGPSLSAGDRLLVIAPHPDDEVICNGGVISYAVENHIPVKVVVITDGNDTKTSALVRHNESINGTQVLGLNEDDIIFLGYKDGSLNNLLNYHWNYNNPYTASDGSKWTNYPYAFQKNATYCGNNLADNLRTVVTDFKPTIIIYPSGDDEQYDHQATNGFGSMLPLKLDTVEANTLTSCTFPQTGPVPGVIIPNTILTLPSSRWAFKMVQNGLCLTSPPTRNV